MFGTTNGVITLTGGIDLNNNGCGDSGDIPTGSTLLTGTFTGTTIVTTSGPSFKIAGATFLDQKHPDLVAFYDLPDDVSYIGHFNISFNAPGAPPSTFTSSLLFSGNVENCTP